MRTATHARIAQLVASKHLGHPEGSVVSQLLERGSVAPDERRGGRRHHDAAENQERISTLLWRARRLLLQGDSQTAAYCLGYGLHFIADSFGPSGREEEAEDHRRYEAALAHATVDRAVPEGVQAPYPPDELLTYIYRVARGYGRPPKAYPEYGEADYNRDFILAVMLCAMAAVNVLAPPELAALPKWRAEVAKAERRRAEAVSPVCRKAHKQCQWASERRAERLRVLAVRKGIERRNIDRADSASKRVRGRLGLLRASHGELWERLYWARFRWRWHCKARLQEWRASLQYRRELHKLRAPYKHWFH